MEVNDTVPYNGEESELRDFMENMVDTNKTEINISDVVRYMLKPSKLLTDQDKGGIAEEVCINLYPRLAWNVLKIFCHFFIFR